MDILKVQFNHPGKQKLFKIGHGYRKVGSNIIREWNNEEVHYRKFILNEGVFIDDISDIKPKKTDLYFWGEWEGNSSFKPITNPNYLILPNGIHYPFHSTKIIGNQNTDPFVFGDCFKYCICKQNGNMRNLIPASLILFGSVFPNLNKFYIDTVFVIKDYETSSYIQGTGAVGYSHVYREETLERLNNYLKIPLFDNDNKIYHSQTWWDNNEYFSFVPCKLKSNDQGFERLFLNLNDPTFNLSSYPSGKSFLKNCKLTPKDLWLTIAKIAKDQGFKLGIQFTEPHSNPLCIG